MSKVDAIKAIEPSTKVYDVRRFLGLLNYYMDMWHMLKHTLDPLTKFCYAKVKLKWTDIEKNAFMTMKKIVGRDVLLYTLILTKRL